MLLRYHRTIILAIFLFAGFLTTAGAAPKPELWARWQEHDQSSTTSVDHSPWGQFLDGYLVVDHPSGVNRVRYSEVRVQDLAMLQDYMDVLQKIEVSGLNRAEQKAYWINLYNSLVVKVVLEHYPVESIQDIDISPGLFGLLAGGPWKAKLVEVQGGEIALDDIEHRILRPIWKDNRIHYAVNCASIGCPNLQPEPFTAENTDRLLNKGAEEYINHPRGMRFVAADQMILSSIYDWFQEDFGGSEKGVIQHLMAYAKTSSKKRLRSFDGGIKYKYDWGLNGLK